MWNPSHYLNKGVMPKLWVSGTNDFAYPMDSLQKSYRIAGGRSTLCIRLQMPHGHGGAGENPAEIRAFADSIVRGGKPLAQVTSLSRDDERVRVEFRSEVSIVKAELLYTNSSGPWTERRWEQAYARVEPNGRAATSQLPPGTTAYYLNLHDDRELIVSAEHVTTERQGE
jgi:hypothetical protein